MAQDLSAAKTILAPNHPHAMFFRIFDQLSTLVSYIAQICYYDPQSAGINVQSPQSAATPRRLTLRDIHIECSKQFKYTLYFYVSGQIGSFWAVLKLLTCRQRNYGYKQEKEKKSSPRTFSNSNSIDFALV